MNPFDRVVLHSERLHLRSIVSTDAEALYAIFSDPLVMRYFARSA